MRWVALRWSDWLRSLPPESWHGPAPDGSPGSLFAARAVLRMLQRLKLSEDRAFRIEHLGLRPVADHEAPVAVLVAAHLGGQAHCGDDVVATAAALELARWLGVVELDERRRVEAWLRARFDALGESDTGFADRLEIARVLEDPQLLRRALNGRIPEPIPLGAAGTLRAAATACRLEPPDIAPHFARAETADVHELDGRPLAAAAYLADLARLRSHWSGKRHALTAARPETVEAAVAVTRSGRFLAADLATAAPDHETVSTEALTLLTYFPGDRRGMAALAQARESLPATLTASAREEASRLRGENAEIARLAEGKARAEALTARARRVLVVPSLVAAAALAAAIAVLIALAAGTGWAGAATLPMGFLLGLIAVTLALDGVGLASPWALRLVGRLGPLRTRDERAARVGRRAPE
jgi:hypothetical protein